MLYNYTLIIRRRGDSMTQSILLICDFNKRKAALAQKLAAMGYQVHTMAIDKDARQRIAETDLIVLDLAAADLSAWCEKNHPWCQIPLVWWCESKEAPDSVYPGTVIDGIVCPGMTPSEIGFAFLLSTSHSRRRQQWELEREQLISRLAERKWIEQAKGIICEMKNISESEAYAFLRRQAMSDRKKLIDVATSIVKVHELLQEEKKKPL
jgi:response regulator NasT